MLPCALWAGECGLAALKVTSCDKIRTLLSHKAINWRKLGYLFPLLYISVSPNAFPRNLFRAKLEGFAFEIASMPQRPTRSLYCSIICMDTHHKADLSDGDSNSAQDAGLPEAEGSQVRLFEVLSDNSEPSSSEPHHSRRLKKPSIVMES